MDKLGPRGVVDMGIPTYASVASAWQNRRRRRHRTEILQQIEELIDKHKDKADVTSDIHLWRFKEDRFKQVYNSKNTWLLTRTAGLTVDWHKTIWFPHSTPKFSIFAWLAINDRLTTGDRMSKWNVGANTACVFCGEPMETRQHLYFSCGYSAAVWESLVKELLQNRFTTSWNIVLLLLSDASIGKTPLFLLRYSFQASIHFIWRERNARRHGDNPTSTSQLIKYLDKQIRNRISSLSVLHGHTYKGALQQWFGTRGI